MTPTNSNEEMNLRATLHWPSVQEIGSLLLFEVEVQRPQRFIEVEHLRMFVEHVTSEGRPATHVGQENQLHSGTRLACGWF